MKRFFSFCKNNYLTALFVAAAVAMLVSGCYSRNTGAETQAIYYTDTLLTPDQLLGKKLFFDTNLSSPAGQSCATCHLPGQGFTDPERLALSRGAVKTLFGHRNTSTVAYASYAPRFHYDSAEEAYIGGFFWDGRALTLADQASNPLLGHVEMNNSSKKEVVDKVKASAYSNLFYAVYGNDAFTNVDLAFENITEAIEEFEETREVNPFNSKFDFYLKGLVKLTPQEERGLKLFNDTAKGNCAACHPSTPDPLTGAVLFTDFTYDNLGIPANPDVITMDKDYKCDLGLGCIVNKKEENGKFKVPTLRNIAVTAPYFHNGVFKTLEESVRFYNNRDSGKFGKPEVEENVNRDELGDLKLSEQEILDIVAFMKTLTDGYQPNAKQAIN